MNDPRIEEVLQHVGKTDSKGKPTELAVVAGRVKAHIEAVEELRGELEEVEGGISDLENRAQVFAETLDERAGHRADLQYEAQDTAVRAALSGTSGGAAHLRKQAEQKRNNIAEFEKDFEEDKKHFEHAKVTLRNHQSRIKQIRDQIARRMNTVNTLLERAEISWPSDMKRRRPSGSRQARRPAARPGQRRPARPMPMPRGNTRRVVVRRRKAS